MERRILRANHMGYTDVYDCLAAVAATEFTLKDLGYNVQIGASGHLQSGIPNRRVRESRRA